MSADYLHELRAAADRVAAELLAVDDEAASTRPAPGRWSPKEIIGHLIDSAANNHQRFVRGRWQDDLVFEGYAQDDWVEAQRYAEAPWAELVTLWRDYNRQLVRVMAAVPDAVRLREHARHSLDRVAWRPLPSDRPATLDYLMRDYVGHLRHHLDQLRAQLGPARPPREPDLSSRPFELAVERRVRLTARALYRAWTEGIDRWFAAPGSATMTPAVGASFFFETEHSPGPSASPSRHPHYGRFLQLEPYSLVRLTWLTAAGGTDGAETVVTVRFAPEQGGTRVALAHQGFADAAARDRHAAAWPAVLAEMERRLADAEAGA